VFSRRTHGQRINPSIAVHFAKLNLHGYSTVRVALLSFGLNDSRGL
jgi:hypothetical protein